MIGRLGYSPYGVYIIAQSLVAIILLFDFGLTSTTEKYISSYRVNKNRDSVEKTFKTILTLYIFVTIFVLAAGGIVYGLIPKIYQHALTIGEQNLLKTLLAIMFTSIGFSLIGSCYNGVLVAYERFTFLRILDIAANFIRFAVIILLIVLGHRVLSVALVDACFNISINTAKIIIGKRVINIPVSFGIGKAETVKPIIRYAWFIFLASIAGQIYWKIDNVILSFIGNTKWVTINGISTQIIMVFIACSSAIVNVFFPKIVKLVDNNADGERLTDEMIKVGRMQALIIGLLFCGVILFGRKFVLLWVGSGCIEAYYIVLATLLPMSILMVQNLGIYILQAKNLHRFRSLIMFVMATLNVVLTIVFVKFWGVVGAGVATGLGLFLGNVVCLNVYYHRAAGLNIKRFFAELTKGIGKSMIICMAVGYVITTLFRDVTLSVLAVEIVLFVIIYIAVFYLLAINEREREYIMEILREIKSIFKRKCSDEVCNTLDQAIKHNCCGCGACMHICPQKCIEMVSDEEGFLYPEVDAQRCTNCGRCTAICPMKEEHESHRIKCYAAWNKNEAVRLNSTSGGAFSAFAQSVINMGGWVYGAAFDNDIKCRHMGVNSADELNILRCSKYVQSDMNDVMPQIKEKLDNNLWVLFCGTPCQAAGLKKYLGKDYEKLLTIDIVCHGVPSPKIFADYINDIETMEECKVSKYQFRSKKDGWTKATCRLEFADGKVKLLSGIDDSYCRGFLKSVFHRPSCYSCMLKTPFSQADISLGDFWGIEKVDKTLFSQKGVSLVICNTQKGEKWLDLVKDKLEVYPEKIASAIPENPRILSAVEEPKTRKKFWRDYKKHGYSYVKNKYLHPPSKFSRMAYNYAKKAVKLIKK